MRLILHPGAPKCATTYLQHTFARMDVNCLARPCSTPDYARFRDELRFGESDEDIKAGFSALAIDRSKTNILSDEILFHAECHSTIARRIALLSDDVRIILTTRDQRTAIPSLYQAHKYQLKGVPEPFNGRTVSFDSWMNFIMQKGLPLLDFWKAYQAYSSVFGRERVHVLPMELLSGDPDAWAARISAIAGVSGISPDRGKINVSPSSRQIAYQKFRRSFLRGKNLIRFVPGAELLRSQFHRYLDRGEINKPRLSEKQKHWIANYYRQGNERLVSATRDSVVSSYLT